MVAVKRTVLDDMGSPQPFKQNYFASTPLLTSMVTSLKSKKSRLKLSSLNCRLRVESGNLSPGGVKNKDHNTAYPNPSPGSKPEEMRYLRRSQVYSHSRVSYRGTENYARRSETTQQNLNKSKTISRLLSSKFLMRSRTTSPKPSQPLLRSPTRIVSAFGSKETRDAALRERGLLPPLKPNVDLSLVERERDRHLPVLTPPHDGEVFAVDGQGSKISAAAKVKQDWETKYGDGKGLEQMRGSIIGDLTPPPMKDVPLSANVWPSASLEQPSTCCEVPNLSPIATTSTPLIKSTPTPSNSLSNNLGDYDFPIKSRPPFSSTEPYLTPLPPSPSSSSFSNSHEEKFMASLSLLQSSGFGTSSASPTVSITPPVIPPLHSLTGSESLLLTPVFHAASPAMTAPHVTSITTSPDLFENDDVLMTASPVETPLMGHNSASSCPRDSGHFEVTLTPYISAAGSTDLPKGRLRNFTDPADLRTHQVEPCKSSSYTFKRFTDFPPSINSQRRLSIRASLNNLRRSLVGTLSRAKSARFVVRTDTSFNPPYLPPSPTPPVTGIVQAGVSQAAGLRESPTQCPASPELMLRVSVSPTLYSRGTIVAETNNIEDEESRRMTELAFLG